MFEHLKMSKKLKQQLSKVLSIALSVAMLAGTIPADMLGGIADVKAADSSVTAAEGVTFPTEGAISGASVGTAINTEDSKYYFNLPADTAISITVDEDKTGNLSVDANPSDKLTLTEKDDTTKTAIASSDWAKLAAGSYVLTATAETKLYSISLTHSSIEGTGGGGETQPENTVTATVTTTFASGLTSSKYVVKLKEEITGEGTADEKTITDSNSASVTLKKGADYVVECTKDGAAADNVSVTVKVGDSAVDKITTSGDVTVTVEIAPKETVKASVAITNNTGETTLPDLTDLKLVCAVDNCANSADEDYTLTDGGEVSLKFGHQYSLTSAPSGYTATLSGATNGVLTVDEDTKTITVTVTKNGSGEITTATQRTYTFSGDSMVDDAGYAANNNYYYPDKTLVGTDLYFQIRSNSVIDPAVTTEETTVNGAVRLRLNGTIGDGGFHYLELSRIGTGGIEFNVKGTADVKITVSSTGNGNYSQFALMNASDAAVSTGITSTTLETVDDMADKTGIKDGIIKVQNTTQHTITYTGLTAGKYTLVSPYVATATNGTNGRGGRVISVEVKDTAVYTDADTRADFTTSVDAPEVTEVTQKAGTSDVEVKVNALVGYNGGDKVTVTIEDAEGNEIVSGDSAIDGAEQTVTLSLSGKSSGKYTAKAKLSRDSASKETDATTSKEFDFLLPLAAPKKLSASDTVNEDGSISLNLQWESVQEADKYAVTVTNAADTKLYEETVLPANLAVDTDGICHLTIDSDETAGRVFAYSTDYNISVSAVRIGTGAENADETGAAATLSYTVPSEEEHNAETEPVTYTLNISDEYTKAETLTLGESNSCGTDRYFTIYYKADGTGGSKTETSAAKFGSGDDEEELSMCLNTQTAAKLSPKSGVIEFSPTAEATVNVYWRSGGSDERVLNLYGENGNTIESKKTIAATISTFNITAAGTYYLGGGSSIRIYKVVVNTTKKKGEEVTRTEWSQVAVPVIGTIAFGKDSDNNEDKTKLSVPVTADISNAGGDSLKVVMTAPDGTDVSQTKNTRGSEFEFTFSPISTGTYKFQAFLYRDGEDGPRESAIKEGIDFVLPLTVPDITMFYSNGTGANNSPKLRLEWGEVQEATSYIINITEKLTNEAVVNDEEYTLEQLNGKTSLDIEEGLEKGKTYVAKIKAKRAGSDIEAANTTTAYSEAEEAEATGEVETAWDYVIYGLHDGKVEDNNGCTDGDKYNNADKPLNYDDAFLRMWSQNKSGKIQPTATDGLAFYYTKINPQTQNFKLSAVMHVNSWTYDNGQEGFGLMATDRIGTHGDSSEFYTNSYQALASKIQYRWDSDKAAVGNYSNTDLPRYEMQLGIGSTEKRGITAANKDEFKTDTSAAVAKYYKCETKTLETSLVNDYGSGKYNIIGNYTSAPAGTVLDIVDMKLTLELNNTGYFLSCTPVTVAADGTITEDTEHTYTNKYYIRDALSMIEEDGVYVGFFTGRSGDVTFRDVKFTTEDYDPNGPVETKPVDYVTPSFDVTSGSVANNEEYELLFGANWQGTLTMKDEAGNVIIGYDTDLTRADGETDEEYAVRTGRIVDIYDEELKEYKYEYNMVRKLVNIDIGTNTFYWTFKPDDTDAYNPEPELDDDGNVARAVKQLEDYTTKTGTFTVTYKAYGEEGTALYVSPKGSALGTGTKANPLDIYTAVKYVKPGQTIYLMEGSYNLAKTVTIDRGVDGASVLDADDKETYEKYIYLLPDPAAKTRPVFDFSRSCEGIVLAGSYWYVSGFDVTRSSLGSDGMRVCGNHNVIDGMNFYDNGNTGLQISRYKGTDTWEYWPAYNLVRNCTSYLNADQGFEDADGFAAKLTINEGNVFDGCVAAYNADDGWDLFAKPESGKIGTVVIKNSIAYRNGYVLIEDTDNDGKISAAEAGAMNRTISFDGIEYPAGNGNGFKMGGNSLEDRRGVGHTLENSFAFYNRAKGIDSNSAPNIKVKNSISFNNESYNIALYGKTATNTDFATQNVISYRTGDEYYVWEQVGVEYQIKTDDAGNPVKAKYNVKSENVKTDDVELNGTQLADMSAVYNDTTYYWDADSQGSYTVDAATAQAVTGKTPPLKLTDSGAFKTTGTKVADNWFAKIDGYADFDAAFKADSSSLRNDDGTVKMQGFLELTADAGSSKWEIEGEKSPEIPENNNETDGSISSGNAGTEASSGVRPEDADKYAEKLTEAKGIATSIGLWLNVVEADEVYYTGKAVRPEIHVYDGTTLLTKKDYTITYKNNINAWEKGRADNLYTDKAPTIIVRGKGNYLGKADDETFEIHPVSLKVETDVFNLISANDITLVSNNREQAVKPKVTFNNRALSNVRDKDYSFQVYKAKTEDVPEGNPESGSENLLAEEADDSESEYGDKIASNKVKDVASYVVELTGHGNYTGTRVINLNVISNTDKDKLASSFKTKLNIREKQREGYKDNYGKDPKYVTLTTTSKDESGKEVSGDLDVRSKSGELLIEGVDYDLSYTNNIEVGMATATITGKSPNYFGTKVIKFRIAAPRINTMLTDNAKATLKFYKQDEAGTLTGDNGKKYSEFTIKGQKVSYTGSAVTFPGLVIGELPNSDKEIKILQLDKDYTLTYKNNNRAGMASVVIKGVGNYSGSVTKTFKIEALDLKNPGKDSNGNNIEVKVSVGGETNTVNYEKGGSKPTVILRIKANGKENKMILGKDYTVTYRNNLTNSVSGNTNDNKKPSVIVRGRGALKGTLDPITYTLAKKDLSDPNITMTADDVRISKRTTVSGNGTRAAGSAYTGSLASRIIITDTNGRALTAGVDYDKNSITYEKISGNGSIAGKGTINAQGVVDTSRKPATATIASNSDVLVIKVTVKAFASDDRKSNNCNYSGEISTTFRVGYAKQSIASARVTVNYDNTTYGNGRYFYYNNGNEIKLFDNGRTKDLTVKIGTEELTYNRSGDDSIDGYTIVLDPYSYVNNTKKGVAKVTIRGTGKYTGTKVITYRIGAKEFNWWKNSSN